MKTFLLYILTFCLLSPLYAQNKYYFSSELYPSYYHFFKGGYQSKKYNLNYGFTAQTSVYSGKVKLGTGVGYMVKSYSLQGDTYSIKTERHRISYLTFPISLNIDICSSRKIHLKPQAFL